jgi:hypothetical protein
MIRKLIPLVGIDIGYTQAEIEERLSCTVIEDRVYNKSPRGDKSIPGFTPLGRDSIRFDFDKHF